MAKPHAKDRPPGLRALDASGDGFWELNLLDGSAWFSDWFYTQLHWTEERRPDSWASLRPAIRPDDWASMLREMRSHLEQHSPFDVEVPIRAPDGAERWWRIRGRAECDLGRQPQYLSGIAYDISEQRAERTALLHELAWLREGFDVLPLAAGLIDAGGRRRVSEPSLARTRLRKCALGRAARRRQGLFAQLVAGPHRPPRGIARSSPACRACCAARTGNSSCPMRFAPTPGCATCGCGRDCSRADGQRQIALVHADH
jgi:hypothetical protein